MTPVVADLSVSPNHAANAVIITVADAERGGVEIALAPNKAIEAAMRLSAAVAKLWRIR